MNERELSVVEHIADLTLDTMMQGVSFIDVPGGGEQGTVVDDPRCCILSTKLALQVLESHFVYGRAMKVQVMVLNEVASREAQRGVLPEDWPEDAFMHWCGFLKEVTGKVTAGGLDGHCIAIVDKEAILDTSAPQFSHPDRGIVVPPLVVDLRTTAGQAWLDDPSQWLDLELDDGAVIRYRQHPDLSRMFDAPDWRSSGYDEAAMRAVIAQRLDERLG